MFFFFKQITQFILNEHALTAFYTYLVYHFLKINRYQLLYCILQYAHAELGKPEDFLKKKNRVNENYS